jgi:amino acid transporter
MRIAARSMLALEGLAVLGILVLSLTILVKVSGHAGLSVQPFIPPLEGGGWSGVGYGLVFAVLSFAGFEGAATLGEETINAHRSIPRAMAGTVILADGFFVLTSYAEVIGFGVDDVKTLAEASAPLNDLAIRFVSKDYATLIELAAAISALACVLGSLCAAARVLLALGRASLAPCLGRIDPVHRTPVQRLSFLVR